MPAERGSILSPAATRVGQAGPSGLSMPSGVGSVPDRQRETELRGLRASENGYISRSAGRICSVSAHSRKFLARSFAAGDTCKDSFVNNAHDSVSAIAEELLAPLNAEQQRLVDLIAGGFAESKWPMFDYVDAQLERDGIDAASTLESLPAVGWYGPASWIKAPGNPPPRDSTVTLTILGLARANWAPGLAILIAYFEFLRRAAEWRRSVPAARRQPRQLQLQSTSAVVTETLVVSELELTPQFWHGLMSHEPLLGGGLASPLEGGAGWEREIPRRPLQFKSVDEYIAATVALMYMPPRPVPMAAPSPLGLVAALDYLDVVWRLVVGGDHLFQLHSAQRAAQLAFPAETENEFASRLTGLGEILRSVRVPGGGRKERDKPLSPLAKYLIAKLPDSQARLGGAIDALHAVIDIRDADQHRAAGSKGASALVTLGNRLPARELVRSLEHGVDAYDRGARRDPRGARHTGGVAA
jgi:hypothetical protein